MTILQTEFPYRVRVLSTHPVHILYEILSICSRIDNHHHHPIIIIIIEDKDDDDDDDDEGQSVDGTTINQDAYNHWESQPCTALPCLMMMMMMTTMVVIMMMIMIMMMIITIMMMMKNGRACLFCLFVIYLS